LAFNATWSTAFCPTAANGDDYGNVIPANGFSKFWWNLARAEIEFSVVRLCVLGVDSFKTNLISMCSRQRELFDFASVVYVVATGHAIRIGIVGQCSKNAPIPFN